MNNVGNGRDIISDNASKIGVDGFGQTTRNLFVPDKIQNVSVKILYLDT